MASKLTQNLTEATVVDKTGDRVPIYSAASPSELRYMTPDNLVPDASTTVKGKVELLTDAETITGVDTTRAMTASNLTAKIDTDGTLTANSDTKIPSQKAVKTYADAIKNLLYPVGTIYTNISVSTNPATLFGFGTWTAIAGRVIVGVGTSDQAFAAGATGGESTHLLTGAESGTSAHSHPIGTNTNNRPSINIAGSGSSAPTGTAVSQLSATENSTAGNASSAHNNLQPYATAYVWQRTA